MIAEPPFEAGAAHEIVTALEDDVVFSEVGGPGVVNGVTLKGEVADEAPTTLDEVTVTW